MFRNRHGRRILRRTLLRARFSQSIQQGDMKYTNNSIQDLLNECRDASCASKLGISKELAKVADVTED